MCTSVPQMDVFKILISTSLMPGSGTGASASHRPCSGLLFINVFMVFGLADMEVPFLQVFTTLVPLAHAQQYRALASAGYWRGPNSRGASTPRSHWLGRLLPRPSQWH